MAWNIGPAFLPFSVARTKYSKAAPLTSASLSMNETPANAWTMRRYVAAWLQLDAISEHVAICPWSWPIISLIALRTWSALASSYSASCQKRKE